MGHGASKPPEEWIKHRDEWIISVRGRTWRWVGKRRRTIYLGSSTWRMKASEHASKQARKRSKRIEEGSGSGRK